MPRDHRRRRGLHARARLTPHSDDIRLFLTDPETGGLLGSFANVERLLARAGARLAFAMNGGMYHPDRSPVGLHVAPEGQSAPLVTSAGPGNFGMLPNGVFCVGERPAPA